MSSPGFDWRSGVEKHFPLCYGSLAKFDEAREDCGNRARKMPSLGRNDSLAVRSEGMLFLFWFMPSFPTWCWCLLGKYAKQLSKLWNRFLSRILEDAYCSVFMRYRFLTVPHEIIALMKVIAIHHNWGPFDGHVVKYLSLISIFRITFDKRVCWTSLNSINAN